MEGDLDLDELSKDELNSMLKDIHSKDALSIYDILGEFLSKDEIDILLAGGIPESCQVVAVFTENSKDPKDS